MKTKKEIKNFYSLKIKKLIQENKESHERLLTTLSHISQLKQNIENELNNKFDILFNEMLLSLYKKFNSLHIDMNYERQTVLISCSNGKRAEISIQEILRSNYSITSDIIKKIII